MEVHCAADEHCYHAISLPLGDDCVTVHPLDPRKPFAKLLDKAGLLEPILSDAFARTLQGSPAQRETPVGAAASASPGEVAEQRILVAQWKSEGPYSKHWAPRDEVLSLFFGKGAPMLPRPGDWFCGLCHRRNMFGRWFCQTCQKEGLDSAITDIGVPRIPGGTGGYPRSGDWGCGQCAQSLYSYQRTCTKCGAAKSHPKAVICP